MTYYGNDERHFQTVVLEKCSSYNNLSIESHESVYADRIKDRLLGTLANMIHLYSTALYIAVPSEYALVWGPPYFKSALPIPSWWVRNTSVVHVDCTILGVGKLLSSLFCAIIYCSIDPSYGLAYLILSNNICVSQFYWSFIRPFSCRFCKGITV